VLVVAGLLVFIPLPGTAFVSAPDGVIEFCDGCEGVFPDSVELELCPQPTAAAVNRPRQTTKLMTLVLFFITSPLPRFSSSHATPDKAKKPNLLKLFGGKSSH
jgi:hypothetical protein